MVALNFNAKNTRQKFHIVEFAFDVICENVMGVWCGPRFHSSTLCSCLLYLGASNGTGHGRTITIERMKGKRNGSWVVKNVSSLIGSSHRLRRSPTTDYGILSIGCEISWMRHTKKPLPSKYGRMYPKLFIHSCLNLNYISSYYKFNWEKSVGAPG